MDPRGGLLGLYWFRMYSIFYEELATVSSPVGGGRLTELIHRDAEAQVFIIHT